MSAAPVPAPAIAAAAAAARDFLRMADGGEDDVLARAAAGAIGLGEAFTGVRFVARACEDVVRGDGAWQRLGSAPVRAILGVTALPDGAAPFVVPPAGYAGDIDRDGEGWIRVTGAAGAARVAVAYEAGLATDWAGLPAPIAQATVALAAHLFTDRAGEAQPPAAIAALWRPWRRMVLGAPIAGRR